MKNKLFCIAAIFLMIGTMAGCEGGGLYIRSMYGPDATPEQIMNDIYTDGYALGSYRARQATNDIPDILRRCYAIKNSPDPAGEAAQALFEVAVTDIFDRSIGNDTGTNIAFTWAMQRLSRFIGFRFNKDDKSFVPIEGFNPERFMQFINAYTDGVEDYQKSITAPPPATD